MQAWKELQYVNHYRLNSDNRRREIDEKRTTSRKDKNNNKKGLATCSHNENFFSSTTNMAMTGPEQKRHLNKTKVQL